jgi:hypothetical protein
MDVLKIMENALDKSGERDSLIALEKGMEEIEKLRERVKWLTTQIEMRGISLARLMLPDEPKDTER